ncbi:MAG: hypothetical protein COA32_16595 [Fluviicola sp.]|nr:MAG: hypothetical protein COA32_16595 [Fluviicola sp.]
MKKIILSMAAFVMLSFNTFSQTPEAFKYQAVVRDGSNLILANQNVGVQLRILQGSPSGTAVYTETFTVTTNQFGLINLEIGTGTTTDDFSLIDWGNDTYFVENGIDVTGGTSYSIMGTSQLLSVPYALHAKSAESVANDLVDDADADPTNELQDWSSLPGIPADIVDGDDVDDADNDPTNEIETWSTLSGIPADIADGDDVDDADNDPTNEIETWSTLSGIPADIADGDDVDDADNDPTNEIETWSTLSGIPADIADGDDVDDADNDPTNEIETWSTLSGIPADIADGDDTGDTDWTISGTDQYSAVTGNVGVGTTTPDNKLDVNGKITLSQSVGDEMVIINDDLWEHGSGVQDFGVGGAHFIMASRETDFESAGIYGDGNAITLWSPGDANNGQPSALIYVNDEDRYDGATDNDPYNNSAVMAYLNTAGNWVAPSDKNRKENIQELEGVLQKLMAINGYTYNFKLAPVEVEKGDQKVTTYGVIAQEVVKAFPEIVDIAADGSHYVSYTELIPVLIESIQEQQEMIQNLQNENDELKSRLDAMDARLKAAGL